MTPATGSSRPPIFIVGTGRSGSTVFHYLLSKHPRVAWPAWLAETRPNRPQWGHWLMRALDWPLLGPVLLRYVDQSEAYPFWDLHYPGFSRPARDLRADDVTERARRNLPAALNALRTSKRNRLLLKITGWPRLGFLQGLFPEATFIHVVRDGRAVVNSMLNVPWWDGWQGPSRWSWGSLSPASLEEWVRHDRSFVALAAIQWKMLMGELGRAKVTVAPERFLEIRYEDLCAQRDHTFQQVLDFTGLEADPAFARRVAAVPLRSENDKWRRDLSNAQQRILNEVLQDELTRLGYEAGT